MMFNDTVKAVTSLVRLFQEVKVSFIFSLYENYDFGNPNMYFGNLSVIVIYIPALSV